MYIYTTVVTVSEFLTRVVVEGPAVTSFPVLWIISNACRGSDYSSSPLVILLKKPFSSCCNLLRVFMTLCVHVYPLGFNDMVNAHERRFCWLKGVCCVFFTRTSKGVRAPEIQAGLPLPSMHLGVMWRCEQDAWKNVV